jgi:hypothetical protein
MVTQNNYLFGYPILNDAYSMILNESDLEASLIVTKNIDF